MIGNDPIPLVPTTFESESVSCSPPWTVAQQSPLSIGYSRQEYWSGLPCPPPGDFPDPVIKPASLASPEPM